MIPAQKAKNTAFLIGFISLWLFGPRAHGQQLIPYHIVGEDTLYLEVHTPLQTTQGVSRAAVVFFFGGGWVNGSRDQFRPHAQYFAKRGLVCFLADYRTKNRHGTDPFTAVNDAKRAMRFVRRHAVKWQVDISRIAAAGGSAGGHLAAATALLSRYSEGQDTTVSCKPNALVLFNPVLDNGPTGYGFERIGAEYPHFSPLHNLQKGAPPTVIFLGTQDNLIPVATMQYVKSAMEGLGNRCDLLLYEGQGHGFFNHRNLMYYQKTLLEADHFLQSIGFLSPQPVVQLE